MKEMRRVRRLQQSIDSFQQLLTTIDNATKNWTTFRAPPGRRRTYVVRARKNARQNHLRYKLQSRRTAPW